jgi:hypothetical protein
MTANKIKQIKDIITFNKIDDEEINVIIKNKTQKSQMKFF